MPGMPSTGPGGQFGGPRHGRGDVPGAGGRGNTDSGVHRGRFTPRPEAGLHRAEWQWRGRAPDAQRSYGWDYQGGVGRDEVTQRTEARMGPSFQARMAQERGGGLPRGRYAVEYDRLDDRTRMPPDRARYGRGGGMGRPYGGDFRAGTRDGGTGRDYGEDFREGYGASRGGGSGRQARYGRDFGGRGERGRGYGADFGGRRRGIRGGGDVPPLSDEEFFRRVEHW